MPLNATEKPHNLYSNKSHGLIWLTKTINCDIVHKINETNRVFHFCVLQAPR